MSFKICTIVTQARQRKAADGTDSRQSHPEHLVPIEPHLSLCGPNSHLQSLQPAGEQFLLASEEAVLGVWLSITHSSGGDLGDKETGNTSHSRV